MWTIRQSGVLLLWMYTLTFVKSQECKLANFINSDLYDSNFDTTNLAASYPDGKTVRVSCNIGFAGFFKLVCSKGTWSSRGSPCQARSCGHPGDASFADFQLEIGKDFVFGSQVLYTCHKGYQMISRSNRRRCLAQGWDGVVPVCEAQQCPVIVVEPNMQVTGDPEEATYGQVIRFSCKSNSDVLVGSSEIYCEENGEWSGPPPKCTVIECFNPDIENGNVPGDIEKYKEHTVLHFECNQGYNPAEGRPSTCTKVGIRAEWSPTPTCELVTCKLTLPITGATSIDPPFKNVFIPGETVTITCKFNYWVGSRKISSVLTCQNNGKWDYEAVCQEVQCPRPDYHLIEYWPRYWETKKLDDTVSYRCWSGFRKTGGATKATCTRDGWSPNPLCQEILCFKPDIENGHVPGYKTQYKESEVLYFTCNSGYKKTDNRPSECSQLGLRDDWKPTPVCEQITCKLPSPQIGTSSSDAGSKTVFLPGENVKITCGHGYLISERYTSAVVTCQANGEWDIQPVCKGITCDYQYDRLVEGWTHSTEPKKVGEIVHYGCRSGYRRTGGAANATCTRDGWSPKPLCEEITCTRPDITNGNVPGDKTDYKSDETLQFECNSGYVASQSNPSTCIITGKQAKWFPPPTCEPRTTCPKAIFPNGFTIGPKNGTLYYSCNDGYKLFRKGWWGEAKCENGMWSGLVKCIAEQQCGEIPVIPNGNIGPSDQVYTQGKRITIQCQDGYQAKAQFMTCSNGKWHMKKIPPKNICEPIQKLCPPPPKVENAVVTSLYQKQYITGATVNYECRKNYKMSGKAEVKCNDGEWELNNLQCTILRPDQ